MTVDTTVNPGHSESVLLAQILQILIAGSNSGSGHFDPSGNPRIFDPANNGYWTLKAPNGVATFSNFSPTP